MVRYLLPFLIFCSTSFRLCAQTDTTVIVLSAVVGEVITYDECERYKLFAQFPDTRVTTFRFLQTTGGDIFLEGTKLNLSSANRVRVLVPYTQSEFLSTRVYLEQQSKLLVNLEAARGDSLVILTVYTRNGDHFNAKILSFEDSLVVFLTKYGVLEVPMHEVRSAYILKETTSLNAPTSSAPIKTPESQGSGNEKQQGDALAFFPNPTPTRYLFAPSAIPLSKQEGYYQNVYATIHAAYYGISDHVSVGGGLETISLLVGSPIGFATVRAGYQVKPKLYLGAGAIALGGVNNTSFFAGGGYGNATFGSAEKSVTTTLGMLYGGGQPIPVVIVSAMKRQQRRLCLVTENWFLSADGSNVLILSGGIRIIGESFSVDLSLVTNPQLFSDGIPAVPFAGFTIKI